MDRIGPLVRKLQKLAPWTGKDASDTLTLLIDDLEPLALAHGLDRAQFASLWSTTLAGDLGSAHALRLLPLFLPRTPVPAAAVLHLASLLGAATHNKPLHKGRVEYKVQQRALELIRACLAIGALGPDASAALEVHWGVYARGLEYGVLRDPTARLLLLVTRRHHVQLHRIQQLQRIIAKTSPTTPPSLHALLALYKSFYPEHVLAPSSASSSHKIRTSKAAAEWEENARRVFGREAGDRGDGERASKRRKVGVAIPSGATFDAGTTSTPLSDINSLAALARGIDRLDLPSMAGSIFGAVSGSESEDRRTKVWGVLLRAGFGADQSYVSRLSRFLTLSAAHQLSLDTPGDEDLEDLLQRAVELSSIAGELPTPLSEFLSDFLKTWDGEWARSVVFDLVALVPPLVFSDLHASYLAPLHALSLSAPPVWLADLVHCLEELVRNWASKELDEATTVWGTATLSRDAVTRSLQSLVSYADQLISAGVITYPTSVTLRAAALSFFETALTLPLAHGVPVVVIPSPAFTYNCLLSPELSSISRICGIISRLREALAGEQLKYDLANTALAEFLNKYLREFINALWSKKLLDKEWTMGLEPTEVERLKDMCGDREQDFASALGLTVHPALATIAKTCLAKMAENAGSAAACAPGSGPVLPACLKDLASRGGPKIAYKEFCIAFLEHLQEQGAHGIHEFFFTSLQSLIDLRKRIPRSPASR